MDLDIKSNSNTQACPELNVNVLLKKWLTQSYYSKYKRFQNNDYNMHTFITESVSHRSFSCSCNTFTFKLKILCIHCIGWLELKDNIYQPYYFKLIQLKYSINAFTFCYIFLI